MLVTVHTPYVDTAAGDLSHLLGGPERPALFTVELPAAPGSTLRLRLLGASHQVVLQTPAGRLVETVACLPGHPAALPAHAEEAAAGYRFTARVLRLAPADLAARVAGLRREFADDERAIVGVFPGDPDAVTVLHAVPAPAVPASAAAGCAGSGPVDAGQGAAEAGMRRVGWRTWHAYPQTGELVETESLVETERTVAL